MRSVRLEIWQYKVRHCQNGDFGLGHWLSDRQYFVNLICLAAVTWFRLRSIPLPSRPHQILWLRPKSIWRGTGNINWNKNYGQNQNIYVAVYFTGKGCSMPHIRPPLTMIVPARRSCSNVYTLYRLSNIHPTLFLLLYILYEAAEKITWRVEKTFCMCR